MTFKINDEFLKMPMNALEWLRLALGKIDDARLAIVSAVVLSHLVVETDGNGVALLRRKLVYGISEESCHESVGVNGVLHRLQYHLSAFPRSSILLAHPALSREELCYFKILHILFFLLINYFVAKSSLTFAKL